MADFTCALAIGQVYSIPVSCFVACICRGGVPASVVPILAPILPSGSVILRMGRPFNEPSPVKTAGMFMPASKPVSNRMPVPELPR